ncbi:Uncharacterised protein [Campylobacter hyointestinalis subsp. hyointestinalis]|uniref:Lipoprotein n=2 Tax=Campylobacter hyointestinalis TaxID=198 RepID=A0A0S4SX96_CAMHY|nr:Uncharacterised protein [Campylobacter hyointestinalis subsp. hyointestinalis]
MKTQNFVFIMSLLVVFSGCAIGPATYENFVKKMELNKKMWTPNEYMIKNFREIYSEDKYIYVFRNTINGCVYGYLTNRDGKPERVIDWIILSGKEYCKERQRWTLS